MKATAVDSEGEVQGPVPAAGKGQRPVLRSGGELIVHALRGRHAVDPGDEARRRHQFRVPARAHTPHLVGQPTGAAARQQDPARRAGAVLKRLGRSGIRAGATDLADALEPAYAAFAATRAEPS